MDRIGELETILAAAARARHPARHRRARAAHHQGRRQVGGVARATARSSASPRPRSCDAVERLRAEGMLDCLQLLHFHIGSQITNIRAIKDALREASRIFVELHALGANMRYLDCGGGLGVDYDGSQTNFHSSVNYTLQEYAADVVSQIAEACNARGRAPSRHRHRVGPRPRRAPLGAGLQRARRPTRCSAARSPSRSAKDEHPVIQQLCETYAGVSRKNFQEAYHDALQIKEEAITAFNLGFLDLQGARARRGALLGHLREDPEDRARPALRARRARGPREAARRHLLLQLLALPVAARPLGGAASSSRPCPIHRLEQGSPRGAACSPTSPATATARSTSSSTCAT